MVLTGGETRRDNYERMAEILRRTELRGDALQTNTLVHYGLINWFLGKGTMAEPDTRFMQSYLAAVGSLQKCIDGVDLEVAVRELASRQPDAEARALLAKKRTLLVRPIERLLASSHMLAGFLGRFDGDLWRVDYGVVSFADNPVRFLHELYHYLNMEEDPSTPPSEKIWDHDGAMLRDARSFYAELFRRTGPLAFSDALKLFAGSRDDRVCGGDEATWRECLAAHGGHQLGLELLLLIPRIGVASGFSDVAADDELRIVFPDAFLNPDAMSEYTKALAPLPAASADEIVTPMGGAFYAREAPHLPALVDVGDHFEAGQPLFIIEVMKMFNKILAPFAGTVTESLMAEQDGVVVAKGQTIFRIEPDERIEEESLESRTTRVRAATLALL